jgi:protein-S-isoprenylcysteine O-methyltransferase Ste14
MIVEGPFRFSRNPMYLGMILALLGVCVLLGSPGPSPVPVVFYLIMRFVFIPAEERTMEETFGEEFERYRHAVRRWI